jgi:short subunit dehydrogenase-like uncharacterized protein
MSSQIIIYGCYGYTGQLIVEEAVRLGMQPVLSGRDAERVFQLAKQYHLEARPFPLSSAEEVSAFLQKGDVMLNCAGPFAHTADVMINACLLAGCHYLDITGEYQVFESAYMMDSLAKKHGILLMPGTGFDVVPSDCLSLFLKEKLPTADKLSLCLISSGGMLSHGTALTILEGAGMGTMVRRKNRLVKIPTGKLTRSVNIPGRKKMSAVAISWGDISTAFRSTAIPNITVYNALPDNVISNMSWLDTLRPFIHWGPIKRFLQGRIKKKPAGPSHEQRQKAKMFIWGEVFNNIGSFKRYLLETPEGYTLTAMTSVDIAKQISEKTISLSGFYTPAQAFGSDYILKFEGVKLSSLDVDSPTS